MSLKLKEILSRLRSLREGLSVTQGQAARGLGVERSTYVRKERGVIPVTTEEWLKLSAILNSKPSYFFEAGRIRAEEAGLTERERGLIRLWRALREREREELVSVLLSRFRGIRRDAVKEALRLIKGE